MLVYKCLRMLLILQLILNDEEVKIKTAMWMRQNADFLKEMKGICIVNVSVISRFV